MIIETILFAVLLVAALTQLPVVRRRGKLQILIVGAGGMWFAVSAWSAIHPRNTWVSERQTTNRPIQLADDGYATSTTCKACHPHNYATWDASYHQSMTQIATPETTLGRFLLRFPFGVKGIT